MHNLIKETMKVRINEGTDEESKTYTIAANPDVLKRLDKLLVACQYMGNGSSRSILFSFDGDGADRLRCEELKDVKLSKEEADKLSDGSGILINKDGEVSKMTKLPEWETEEPKTDEPKTREPYHSLDPHDGIGEDDGW